MHKADKWTLADVVTAVYISDIPSAEKVKEPPREGVYLTGLFLDGATWSASEASLVESQPKQLFASLPVVHVTAVTKTQQRSMVGNYGPFGGYECPFYRYPVRTDRYLITHATLSSQDRRPEHWALRGVAMLCDTQ
jgi:dynein heavy chain